MKKEIDKDAFSFLSMRVCMVVLTMGASHAINGLLYYAVFTAPVSTSTMFVLMPLLASHTFFNIFVTDLCLRAIPKLKQELHLPVKRTFHRNQGS